LDILSASAKKTAKNSYKTIKKTPQRKSIKMTPNNILKIKAILHRFQVKKKQKDQKMRSKPPKTPTSGTLSASAQNTA
jgi:hypothetical protein